MEIRNGTRWSSNDGKVFIVISTTVVENKDWVYYRSEKAVDNMPKEFSCYKESFVSRFFPLPE